MSYIVLIYKTTEMLNRFVRKAPFAGDNLSGPKVLEAHKMYQVRRMYISCQYGVFYTRTYTFFLRFYSKTSGVELFVLYLPPTHTS